MKYPLTLLTLAVAMLFMSCENNDNSISFGTVEYYPDFLWVDAKETPVSKTLGFDFSEDAKADAAVFAELQFVDNDGQPMSTDIMQVYADGLALENNILRIDNTIDSIRVTFCFKPDKAESGNYQGRLRLIRHHLDRLDSQVLSPNDQADAFVWTLKYEETWNPLAKVLMWVGFAILIISVLWFACIRRYIFPRFRLNHIELFSNKGYYVSKKINGARKVVFTNQNLSQSWLNKQLTRRIVYIKDDRWTSSWELIPHKRTAKANLHGKYAISPFATELTNFVDYTIDNISTHDSITLKLL